MKLFLLAILLLSSTFLVAQNDFTKKWTFSGYGEIYYSYDFTNPENHQTVIDNLQPGFTALALDVNSNLVLVNDFGTVSNVVTSASYSTVEEAIVNLTPYKIYRALLSQSGTSAPVATVIENTLGGSVSWGYAGVGYYTATLTGAFLEGKTAVKPPSNNQPGSPGTSATIMNFISDINYDNDSIYLTTGYLTFTTIESNLQLSKTFNDDVLYNHYIFFLLLP